MKIFANGCSYTWGGGLYNLVGKDGNLLDFDNRSAENIERLSVTWPGVLGELTKSEDTVNYALPCGSNDRILRTTLNFFGEKLANGDRCKDWIAIIQLTYAPRFEFFDEKIGKWSLVKQDNFLDGNGTPYDSKTKERLENYYRFNNDVFYQNKTFHHICTLGHFFSFHKIKYFFWTLYNDQLYLDTMQKKYCNKHFNWMSDDIDFHPKATRLSCGHPTKQGHIELAKLFRREIKHL